MIIQHNISALNSYRNLSMNNNAISGNLEKLSSGYAINRAGDDAAGLAISEKMRAQITGLETAQANAEDGISLVQTAEGALTEVHTMLNRMVELAQQSSNGTIQNEVDRENIQEEVEALKSEIDRISESTNFNGINLLDGSLKSGNVKGDVGVSYTEATANEATMVDFADSKTGLAEGEELTYTVSWKDADGNEKSASVTFTGIATTGKVTAEDGTEYSLSTATPSTGILGTALAKAIVAELSKNESFAEVFDVEATGEELSFTSKQTGSEGATITGASVHENSATVTAALGGSLENKVSGVDSYQKLDFSKVEVLQSNATADDVADAVFEIDGEKFVLAASDASMNTLKDIVGSDVTVIDLAGTAYVAADAAEVAAEIGRVTGLEMKVDTNEVLYTGDKKLGGSSNGLSLQIGDTSDDFNNLTVSVDAMDTESLGINNVDLSTQEGAKAAVEVIKEAINKVSSTRGGLGAVQNRLEHTINNLGVTAENMTAAESRIRDVDMAKEMMEYTKNNILIQSSQAMLAQANQLPQGVLQLLQ